MKNGLTIGLLSPFQLPIPGYEQAANDLGLNLLIVTPRLIDWAGPEVTGLVWNGQTWETRSRPLPGAFYNRYYGPKPQVIQRLESLLGPNKVFNHITRFDKWAVHKLLNQSELGSFLPTTMLYTPENLQVMLNQFEQVIVKPRRGQLGQKIWLISAQQGRWGVHLGSKSALLRFDSTTELIAKVNSLVSKNFMIQQFLPLAALEGRVFDVRCLVQKGELGNWQVTALLSRLALRYSYITNLSHSIKPAAATLRSVFPAKNLLPKLQEISLKGARIVEESLGALGEISVDFGLDSRGRIWIIELNSKPMKSIFEALDDPKLLHRIYQAPLRYARYLTTS